MMNIKDIEASTYIARFLLSLDSLADRSSFAFLKDSLITILWKRIKKGRRLIYNPYLTYIFQAMMCRKNLIYKNLIKIYLYPFIFQFKRRIEKISFA